MVQNTRQPDGSRADLPEAVFFLFTSAPKAKSDEGERNMLARANYQGFHVGNVLSDPPTLWNVMEAEAKRSGGLHLRRVLIRRRTRCVCEIKEQVAVTPSL